MSCAHCKASPADALPSKTPTAISGTEFIPCSKCGRDYYSAEKLSEWARKTVLADLENTHITPRGAGEPNLQPEWTSLDMAIDPDAHIEQPAAAAETPAPQFLEAAANHMRNRAKQRDSQGGERSMAKTVAAFNTIYGQQLTEEQGWQFMVLLKMTRSAHGIYVQDDYEDGAAYFALAGETASRGRA